MGGCKAGSRYYSDAYKNRNHLGKVVSGQIYTLTSPDNPELGRFSSPLMTVNFEARRMALQFYYLMIPAVTGMSPTIYLNPEWDQVQLDWRTPPDVLDFLWDMRAYDPKGVGLAHWVVSPTVLEKIEAHGCRWLKGKPEINLSQPSPCKPSQAQTNPSTQDWPMPDHDAMADILRSQKSIIFTHKKFPQGQLSYCENFPFDELYLNLPRATTTFDLLETDPRLGVPEMLETMWMDADPLDLMDVFRSLLRHIDAHASAHAAATAARAARAAGQPFIMPDPKRRRKSRTEFSHMICLWPADDELNPVCDYGAYARVRSGKLEVPIVAQVAEFWVIPNTAFRQRQGRLGGMGLYDLSACKPRLGVFL